MGEFETVKANHGPAHEPTAVERAAATRTVLARYQRDQLTAAETFDILGALGLVDAPTADTRTNPVGKTLRPATHQSRSRREAAS